METVSTRNAKNAVHASRDLSPVAEIIQAKFRQKSVNTVTSTTELAESVTKRYEIICHLNSKKRFTANACYKTSCPLSVQGRLPLKTLKYAILL